MVYKSWLNLSSVSLPSSYFTTSLLIKVQPYDHILFLVYTKPFLQALVLLSACTVFSPLLWMIGSLLSFRPQFKCCLPEKASPSSLNHLPSRNYCLITWLIFSMVFITTWNYNLHFLLSCWVSVPPTRRSAPWGQRWILFFVVSLGTWQMNNKYSLKYWVNELCTLP